MATISDVVKRISNGCAVIVCGDMNSSPHSPLHRYFTTEGVDFSNIKAKNVSGQPGPAESHYRYRHGEAGEAYIEHDNLRQAGFEFNSTYADTPKMTGVHRRNNSNRTNSSRVWNDMKLKSAYGDDQPTTVLSSGQQCVDYVFHSPQLVVSGV